MLHQWTKNVNSFCEKSQNNWYVWKTAFLELIQQRSGMRTVDEDRDHGALIAVDDLVVTGFRSLGVSV